MGMMNDDSNATTMIFLEPRKMTVYVLAASFMVEASKWRQKVLHITVTGEIVHTPHARAVPGEDGKISSHPGLSSGVDARLMGICLAPGGHFPQKDCFPKNQTSSSILSKQWELVAAKKRYR
jgi:hypothetical protein